MPPFLYHARLPKVIDLFAGCGGFALGFQSAGFDVMEGFDSWTCAAETYSRNLGHPATLLDLSNTAVSHDALQKYRALTDFPMIIGGPPCQDFSSAGCRIEGDRANLTGNFAALVSAFSPPLFVMENVPRSAGSVAFRSAVQQMESAGYSVGKLVMDACLYGVPQRRKRLITIGTKNSELTSTIIERLEKYQSATPMTVRDWFGDRLGTDTYYMHPRSYQRRGIFSVDEPAPTIRGVNRPIPSGYVGHVNDAGPVAHARPLTTAERAEIQTFPSTFEFIGSRTNIEQMIGNAVPVKLAQFIAEVIAWTLLQNSPQKYGTSPMIPGCEENRLAETSTFAVV